MNQTAYTIRNAGPALSVFFDGRRTVSVYPGRTVENIYLTEPVYKSVRRTQPDLVFTPADDTPVVLTGQPLVWVHGMNGLGDCIHQRAVCRELMKNHDLWLGTAHWHMYHDLIEKGLRLTFQGTRLRAQAKTIAREKDEFAASPPPNGVQEVKLWYRKDQIDVYGSILEAMLGSCGCDTGEAARDFSMPVKPEWTERIKRRIAEWNVPDGKPLMVYRPITLRREWNSANRNPDPDGYAALYEAARQGYFVVSIADLQVGEEWIVGPEASADIKLHAGELPFEELAALWKEASLTFCNAGFGTILSQAVGTPSIIVYGGRESYNDTDRAGAHLAPTLGIDPIKPCTCHSERHDCGDKKIDVPAAIDRITAFVEQLRRGEPIAIGSRPAEVAEGSAGQVAATPAPPRVLIYGTIFVDSQPRQKLCEQWLTLHRHLNHDCDLLLVDSKSPLPLTSSGFEWPANAKVWDFGDNIGHLSRSGQDGWGRAFCRGLEIACLEKYDYAVHIEGDSLLRRPVRPLIEEMVRQGKQAASTDVVGTERIMRGWVETGLVILDIPWVKKRGVVAAYDWRARTVKPTPEVWLGGIIAENMWKMPLKAWRGDKNQINHNNVLSLDLDWITHCHNDIWCYERFVEAAMVPKGGLEPPTSPLRADSSTPELQRPVIVEPTPPTLKLVEPTGLKINLGCGTNKLKGWDNHDADVDITRRLPWKSGAADFIFAEHVVEHVTCHEAIGFFEEAYRVLRPGGVLRVTVPSIEKIRLTADEDYFRFTKKWSGEENLHGALKAIIFCHGHKMIWTTSVMFGALLYAGFKDVVRQEIGVSDHPELRGVEGHGKVIGDKFNAIESECFEATRGEILGKPDRGGAQGGEDAQDNESRKIAIVVGGATNVFDDIARTRDLLNGHKAEWFVVNDMIPMFEGECIVATLHPTRIKAWIDERAKKGHPKPKAVWCNIRDDRTKLITNIIEDWRGSSGMYAARVALHLGYDRIILCGVPMDPKMGNVRGTQKWDGQGQFVGGWIDHHNDLAPYVRSWSGWTKQRLGAPDGAFLC